MFHFILGPLLFLSSFMASAEEVSLRNDREGVSLYATKANQRSLKKAIDVFGSNEIEASYQRVISESHPESLCSYDLNNSLKKELNLNGKNEKYFEGVIYYLRSIDEIDDSIVRILLGSHEVVTTKLNLPKNQEDLKLPSLDKLTEVLPVLRDFEKKELKMRCFDEAYRRLLAELSKKSLTDQEIEATYVEAYQRQKITLSTYLLLEKARVNKLQNNQLSLKNYFQKIRSLRLQSPLRDENEKSQFVTQRLVKSQLSRRQALLENYTDLQIILMSKVIKDLRTRLESPKAEILIYDRAQGVETITLEPMERFRLAIKLLRKEMANLSLNTYFSNRAPSYLDLMTAAYETGTIPASELDELHGLEEIWSPRKTFWEKAKVWVQAFSSVATIVIPPPYGFIPALAIVVIEATSGQKNDVYDIDPTSLF